MAAYQSDSDEDWDPSFVESPCFGKYRSGTGTCVVFRETHRDCIQWNSEADIAAHEVGHSAGLPEHEVEVLRCYMYSDFMPHPTHFRDDCLKSLRSDDTW